MLVRLYEERADIGEPAPMTVPVGRHSMEADRERLEKALRQARDM
jgi:hypothetical protein